MIEKKWELLVEVGGTLQAELLRGLLEAQGIEVELIQEAIGRWGYPTNLGLTGQVQVFVPSEQVQDAQQILTDYENGVFKNP